jgi:hypothetical protein
MVVCTAIAFQSVTASARALADAAHMRARMARAAGV